MENIKDVNIIKIKRVREQPNEEDGFRILVDRLWPVGMTKEKAKLDVWLKEIGPSDGLRKWFSHDIENWEEFKKRYLEELKDKDEFVNIIINKLKDGTVTLLFGSKETKYNNAVVLKEYIESKMTIEDTKSNEN